MLLHKSNTSSGQLSHALNKRDLNRIINHNGKAKIEKCYYREIQALCKIPCFAAVESEPGVINKLSSENVVNIAKEKAPLVSSMVFYVEPSNFV